MREKNINIGVPNLDQRAFGKQGLQTRKEWQAECETMLLAGKDEFNKWQQELARIANSDNRPKYTSFYLTKSDAGKAAVPLTPWGLRPPPSPLVVDLTNKTFPQLLFLKGYVFLTEALFAGCTFEGGVIFDGTVFKKDASFIGSIFLFPLSCSGTTFEGDAIFNDAIFGQAVIFARAKFNEEARFSRVEFQAEANFRGATFSTAVFDRARFSDEAHFSGDSSLNENKLPTFGTSSFSGAYFGDRVDFSNREFADRTSFGPFEGSPTVFTKVPLFHNCKLHQDTTFEEAVFPQPSSNDETDVRAYNALRSAMSKHEFTREQRRFTELELEAQRAITKDKWESFFHRGYKFFSDYGFSIRKPILWLIVFPMFCGVPLYGLVERWSNCASPLSNYSCQWDGELAAKTIEFTVLQSLAPLGFERQSHELRQAILKVPDKSTSVEAARSDYPDSLFTLLVVIQKIASLTGLFLTGLALRNLFKIK